MNLKLRIPVFLLLGCLLFSPVPAIAVNQPINLLEYEFVLEYPQSLPELQGLVLPEKDEKSWLDGLFGPDTSIYRVPAMTEKYSQLPVAMVDQSLITIEQLVDAMLKTKADEEGNNHGAQDFDVEGTLDKLVTARLFALEAAEMGLDQLPEVQKIVSGFESRSLRSTLIKYHLKDVKPDPEVEEQLYLDAVTTWEFRGIYFPKKKDAEAFLERLEAGTSFEDLVEEFSGQDGVQGGADDRSKKHDTLLPEYEEALKAIDIGEVTGLITLKTTADGGFSVAKLYDVKIVDDPEARSDAQRKALNYAKNVSLGDYYESLVDKYATIDVDKLKNIDFSDDFDSKLTDERILAEIEGEEPVTVGAVAKGLKKKYYHGIQRAIEDDEVEKDKYAVFREITYKKLFHREALALELDKSEEYLRKVSDYKYSVMFGAFVQKALEPEVELTSSELENYYQQHLADFTSPAMLRVRALVYDDLHFAEEILQKLKEGADFNWVKKNTEGQVQEEFPGRIPFGDNLVTINNFPTGLRASLENVKQGDYSIYDDNNGHYYLLWVENYIPRQTEPLENVLKQVIQAAYDDELDTIMQQWKSDLRSVYDIKIFLSEI